MAKSKKKQRKISRKIKKLMEEGRPRKQAIAIAHEMAERGEL